MAALRRAATSAAWESLAKSPQSVFWAGGIRYKFSKSRIPPEVFQPKPSDHEKYGGDPQQPHKLHLITRIRSVIGRPYWEKKIVKDFGLVKGPDPANMCRCAFTTCGSQAEDGHISPKFTKIFLL